MEDPARHVSVAGIFALYSQSLLKARAVLDELLGRCEIVPEREAREALSTAMLTPLESVTQDQRAWLDVLRR